MFDVGMLNYGPGAPTPGPALSAGTGPSGRRGEDSAQQRDSLGSGHRMAQVLVIYIYEMLIIKH